jgi:hypothetical protein
VFEFDCVLQLFSFFPFSDDLIEKNQTEVTIHDIDVLALTLLVDFSYTGEIVITEDNVQVNIVLGFQLFCFGFVFVKMIL